jgi:hypothetical protein
VILDKGPVRNFVRVADDQANAVAHAFAVPNPLAIGVTLGGLLLDLIAPRPKPRYGEVPSRAASRTPRREAEQHEGPPVASGSSVPSAV